MIELLELAWTLHLMTVLYEFWRVEAFAGETKNFFSIMGCVCAIRNRGVDASPLFSGGILGGNIYISS